MKKLEKLDDLPYSLSVDDSALPDPTWKRAVVMHTMVVGTDGHVRSEHSFVEVGQLKVTSRTVRIRWSYSHLVRPGEPIPTGAVRGLTLHAKEYPLPRPRANGRSSYSVFAKLADRMNFVACPQHRLFSTKEAKGLCEFVHDYLVVHSVMTE